MKHQDLRRTLFRLYNEDPEAFQVVAADFAERGADALDASGGRRGPKDFYDDNLLALHLAAVRNAREEGRSLEDVLGDMAARGVPVGNAEGRRKELRSEDNAKRIYKKARRREKDSPEFERKVAFYRWAQKALRGQ